MKVVVLAIGRIRSKPAAALASDYASRLVHYLPFELVTCRDDRQALSKLESNDLLILLDPRGEEKSSEQLAFFLAEHQQRGMKRLFLFIGGPDGPGDEVRARAQGMLSLSRMTFPHELAQVLLLEQLYRACTIIKREPYHK